MTERASLVIDAPAGGPSRIARLIDGEPTYVEVDREDQAEYTPPPDGVYELEITGIYEPWTAPKKAEWIKPGGPTEDTMTRLEFEILNGRGKGKRFASRINLSLGPRANLTKVWKAAVGPVPAQPEVMDLLGSRLKLFVARSEPKLLDDGREVVYANPEWATAKPLGGADDDGWDD